MNIRCPFKFSGQKGEDPLLFVSDFRQFARASRLDEAQGIVALRLSLTGEAEVWIRTQTVSTTELESLLFRLITRFAPKDRELLATNELADMKLKSDESIMGFLDKAKGISLKGGVPDQVLLDCVLRALPKDLASRLIMWGQNHKNGLSWETVYEACSQWDVTGLISPSPLFINNVASNHQYFSGLGLRSGETRNKMFKIYLCYL